ncbi:uncharacterized protein LOC105223458 [Bactrocera dorsalis]|uniref:Uncharacterized protein LOC105223458 n=1 Tax=Bactrocera dorsalis TaxID=27457 RepID=A0A6I9UW19_BACDO|nr:uncharacterized protein LOC105223458 [Bactrocera dorsalis]
MDPLDVELHNLHGEVSPESDINKSFVINGNTDDLDKALIQYITTDSRLLFVEREETWNEFHATNLYNTEEFSEYTIEQLCDHFQQKVLPNINTYELTPIQKQMLKLLNLHPEYEQTPTGYTRMSADRRIGFNRLPKEGDDFLLVKQPHQLRQLLKKFPVTDTEFDANKEFDLTKPANEPTHTLLLRCPYERQGTGYEFKFTKENAALLSAALSNDFELSGRTLLEPKELHKRLREAKRNFEQHARMPENCVEADKLVEKVKKLKTLREAVVDVVANRF